MTNYNQLSIPPEALEAAYNARRNGDTLEDICLAMLKHWPGIHVTDHYAGDLDNNLSHREITLPLPKEGK